MDRFSMDFPWRQEADKKCGGVWGGREPPPTKKLTLPYLTHLLNELINNRRPAPPLPWLVVLNLN